MNTFSIAVSKRLFELWIVEKQEGILQLYTLHDIFRLMPKIGEKMGWKNTGNRRDGVCGEPTVHDYSSAIYDAFMLGDYPESEKVLLDLLKEHA